MIKKKCDYSPNIQHNRTDQHRLSISPKETASHQNGHRHRTQHADSAHLLGTHWSKKQAPTYPGYRHGFGCVTVSSNVH